jgi:hypothetical protein
MSAFFKDIFRLPPLAEKQGLNTNQRKTGALLFVGQQQNLRA